MLLTEQEVIDRLRTAVREAGGLYAYGKLHGFTAGYIHDVLERKRGLADRILATIGIVRKTVYLVEGESE